MGEKNNNLISRCTAIQKLNLHPSLLCDLKNIDTERPIERLLYHLYDSLDNLRTRMRREAKERICPHCTLGMKSDQRVSCDLYSCWIQFFFVSIWKYFSFYNPSSFSRNQARDYLRDNLIDNFDMDYDIYSRLTREIKHCATRLRIEFIAHLQFVTCAKNCHAEVTVKPTKMHEVTSWIANACPSSCPVKKSLGEYHDILGSIISLCRCLEEHKFKLRIRRK